MPEPTQFSFTWAEVAELLVKQANLHEGRWVVVPEFGVNAGIIGQTTSNSKPGAAILLNSLQLIRAQADAPAALVVDASIVNPKA